MGLILQNAHKCTCKIAEIHIQIAGETNIKDYSSVRQIEIDSCPLKWWKEHEAKFPHSSKAAREVLAVPATSALSERVLFSRLAQINCKERLSLGGDVVNACLLCSEF